MLFIQKYKCYFIIIIIVIIIEMINFNEWLAYFFMLLFIFLDAHGK